MDHILENEGKPVPDLGSIGTSSSSSAPATGANIDEDDEDAVAIRAALGKPGASEGAGSSSATDPAGGDAKVSDLLYL